MLVIELAALGLSVTTLLLQELHVRRAELRQRPDVGAALIDLRRILLDWAVAARDVNAMYRAWVEAGSHGDFDDYDSLNSQMAVIKLYEDLTGSHYGGHANQPERPPAALERLEIFAPQLREDLGRIAQWRLETHEAVRDVMDDYSQHVTEISEEHLERSAVALEQAAEDLRVFIATNFPATDL